MSAPPSNLDSSLVDFYSLGFSDALRLRFAPYHEGDNDKKGFLIARIGRLPRLRRQRPCGPPDTWLSRDPVIAEFAVEGIVKSCKFESQACIPGSQDGASSALSLILASRRGLPSRTRWGRIANVIRHVILPRIAANVDTTTLYTTQGQSDDNLELSLRGVAGISVSVVTRLSIVT